MIKQCSQAAFTNRVHKLWSQSVSADPCFVRCKACGENRIVMFPISLPDKSNIYNLDPTHPNPTESWPSFLSIWKSTCFQCRCGEGSSSKKDATWNQNASTKHTQHTFNYTRIWSALEFDSSDVQSTSKTMRALSFPPWRHCRIRINSKLNKNEKVSHDQTPKSIWNTIQGYATKQILKHIQNDDQWSRTIVCNISPKWWTRAVDMDARTNSAQQMPSRHHLKLFGTELKPFWSLVGNRIGTELEHSNYLVATSKSIRSHSNHNAFFHLIIS